MDRLRYAVDSTATGTKFVANPPQSLSGPLPLPATCGGISNPRRWLIVGLLFASAVINYLDRATLSVALPVISAELHIDALHKGLLLWSFFASYALMQVPIGWLADRSGLRWLYAGMFALWSLSCGLMGLAGSLAVMIALRVLLGVGESIFLPGGNKIVSSLFAPEDRGLPSGLFDCGTRIGVALGTPLIAGLILVWGWRWMFVFVGFGALGWVVLWLLAFPVRVPWVEPYAVPEESGHPTARRIGITFNRNLLGLCLGFFCYGYYWYLLLTWLPDYLMEARHLSILKAGVYAAVPYLVFAVSEPVGGWVADRLIRRGWDETRTRKGIVTVAFAWGLLLIPATQVERAATAILLLSGASLVGLAVGNLLVILQRCAPLNEIGAWTGFENFAGNLGGVSALVSGFLISRTGSYMPGFVLGPVVLMAGLLAYWLVVGMLPPLPAASDSQQFRRS